MKVAPADGSISPSLKVTSAAPIGGSSPSVKVTPPIEEKSNLGLGQTSLQPTGKIEGNTKLEVPGPTKLDLAGLSKPNQTNLPEKSSPSSAISQTSLQQSAISGCYQHPTPSRSGGFQNPENLRLVVPVSFIFVRQMMRASCQSLQADLLSSACFLSTSALVIPHNDSIFAIANSENRILALSSHSARPCVHNSDILPILHYLTI